MNQLHKNLFPTIKKIKRRFLKEKIYSSYNNAIQICTNKGYENKGIIGLVKAKAKSYRNRITDKNYNTIDLGAIVLSEVTHRLYQTKSITIFDFGGADGIYYLQLRKCLPSEYKLLWCVIETPEMAKEMKEFETEELRFFDSISEALRYTGKVPHIFHTSGAVQYTPEPNNVIKQFIEIGAEYLVFNRQSLINNEHSLISIQTSLLSWHGEGDLPKGFKDRIIKYPHTNISRAQFENLINDNYNILYTYNDTSGIKRVNKEDIIGLCYVWQKKK